ncbi:MAG: glycosyltransferase family 39 protein [Phycisphaerales bacterium]|nr:glycosyltransferase family 39 protein [Phycisphaerales bacterium]MCB9862711.1 glycosyltransferase family 39 protein [Phycisphaerales bacterium]
MPSYDNDIAETTAPPTTGRTTTTRVGAPIDNIVTFETYRDPCPDQPRARVGWKRHALTRSDYAIAFACFAIALVARWPFVSVGETLLHSDEAIVGIMAQDIAAGQQFPIYFYGQRYMGSLEAYTVAAFSAIFDNPIQALRFAPAFYLALIVLTQYLMLKRWFGRAGGLVGAAALIACSPMFMQWSISARGGYVEIMLWGSMLLFAYGEWFVEPIPVSHRSLRKFLFGAITGSGMWINPSIVLFIAPIIVHAMFNRPLAAAWESDILRHRVAAFSQRARFAALPIIAFAVVLTLNVAWATWVADGRVQSQLLLGLLPKPIAVALLMVAAMAAAFAINRRIPLIDYARTAAQHHGIMILGLLVGSTPAILYVVGHTISGKALDPSLPLGFRPFWMAGETLNYLANGLPLLFGPDPRPFLALVGVGRDTVTRPLDMMTAGVVQGAGWLALGAGITTLVVALRSESFGLSRLFRMQPFNHTPATLLLMGVGTTILLYLLGGCVLDFTTIRYLIPLWVFVPGVLAAAFVNRQTHLAGRAAPIALCGAWLVGQFAMHSQLGARHPLGNLADAVQARHIQYAVAEPLDAHLLSYLTRQNCKTIEYESFWPRLAKYFPLVNMNAPMDYIVQTSELDREWDWIHGGWPGQSPPETKRFLWPRLRSALQHDPTLLVHREPLCDGYEWIRLRRPLEDRQLQNVRRTSPEVISSVAAIH